MSFTPMKIILKLRVCNGFGDIVRNNMKENLMKNLMSNSNNAIKPQLKDYPYFTEEFPNNGWTGFDYNIICPVYVYIEQIKKDNSGCFYFIAKRLISKGYIAGEIANELQRQIKRKISESDWIGISASVESVEVEY
jgi:hypothetical protein